MPNTYCYFDVTIGGKPLKERIVIELFDDVTPKTCENFRQLCLGNGGKTTSGPVQVPMMYKGCSFHRVIAGFMLQGGDFTNHNGTGGVSIYGDKFEDENFEVPCEKPGLLAMANAGANTNGSQFFITTAPTPHLTGRHVVFGAVVRGMNAVRAVEHTATGANDKPEADCIIADCGVLAELPPAPTPVDGDAYPDYPEDCDPQLDDEKLVEAGETVRQAGNTSFKQADYTSAVDKYAKAVRYLERATKTNTNEAAITEKLVACHNNSAMCAIKLSQWGVARTEATHVLELDPKNSKALFRRGVAALSGNDTDGAVSDLTAAHAIEPENGEIVAKLNQAKDLVKARNAKLAAGLKKMFGQ